MFILTFWNYSNYINNTNIAILNSSCPIFSDNSFFPFNLLFKSLNNFIFSNFHVIFIITTFNFNWSQFVTVSSFNNYFRKKEYLIIVLFLYLLLAYYIILLLLYQHFHLGHGLFYHLPYIWRRDEFYRYILIILNHLV